MKRLYIVWIVICSSIGLALVNNFLLHKTLSKKIITQIPISPQSIIPTHVQTSTMTKTLFIPYWTLSKEKIDDSNYKQLVYFGITANGDGIDTKEAGYKGMDQFLAITFPQKKRLLGVRMIDSTVNTQVLRDTNLQHTIITQSIQIAKEKGFDGIVLDFELSAISFDNVTKEISNFDTQFATSVKEKQLQFFATVYGDTFFRVRPFDIASIAKVSDGIMIMAYDFHKANGDPGPNFQLQDSQDDGYDVMQMIQQFAQDVPPQKITVIFGMYGYDWQVDAQEQSTKQGIAVSDNIIKQKFLEDCQLKNCKVTKDQLSTETKVTYTDADKNNHIVWFEDMDSVAKKTQFLQSKGIDSIAYWAYSYF